LNQFTANALGIPVLAGPEEATAAGNILIQALALKHLRSLRVARSVVAASFESRTFQPENPAGWREAYARFERWE